MWAPIRVASEEVVSESDSHPFHFQQFLMMHNGGIPQCTKIKRDLLALLHDELFLWIRGQTDSEHDFAPPIQHISEMRGSGPPLSEGQLRRCFQKTCEVVQELKDEAGIGYEISTFSMMATNGHRITGCRYSSNPAEEARPLYYTALSHFGCSGGISRMIDSGTDTGAVLIVSKKLNANPEEWIPIAQNYFIAVDGSLHVHLSTLQHETSGSPEHGGGLVFN